MLSASDHPVIVPVVDASSAWPACSPRPIYWPPCITARRRRRPEIDVNTTEIFLIAMTIIFTLPWLIWRKWAGTGYTRRWSSSRSSPASCRAGHPGQGFPDYYQFVFNPAVVQSLNGIAWWAVMLFVMIAGIELDLRKAWAHRRERHHRRPGARYAAAFRLRGGSLMPVSTAGWGSRRRPGNSSSASAWPVR